MAKSKWIDRKVDMPNYGQMVQVYPQYPGFCIDPKVGAVWVYNDGKGGSIFERDNDTITHWAPMAIFTQK